MKNFLKTSLYVTAFALAGIFFQIACSNSDSASPAAETKFVYCKDMAPAGVGLWSCNYDGTENVQIPITLPAGYRFFTIDRTFPHLSPDGQQVLFVVRNDDGSNSFVFSCNIDGSNLHEIPLSTGYAYYSL